MADLRVLSGLGPVPLFLKATTKKQTWIPTFTRHDGSVVEGHYAMVHVSTDHDAGKILAGAGSHSQRAAHAALQSNPHFHALADEHKLPVLLKHATEIQDKASAAAVVSTFRKKALAGLKPTPAEWKAFEGASRDKQRAVVAELREAGHDAILPDHLRTLPAPQKKADEIGAKKAPISALTPTVEVDKPAPKTHEEHLAAHLDAIDAARLPESNVNARAVNTKLDAIKSALKNGEASLLPMMTYGSNNYGKKHVALANRALELLGSDERVAPGHKGVEGFRSDAQIKAAQERSREERTVRPETDSLMTAVAKLGGLKKDDVMRKWGYGERDMAGHRVGIKPVFSSRGLSVEAMAERLHELGYLASDEHGRFETRDLEEHVSEGLGGSHHFTPEGYANKAERDHEEHYQNLREQDVHESGFDALPEPAQNQIEEFLDENPNFTPEEVENFERHLRLAEEDDLGGLDFGSTESGHRDFGQAHEGSDDVPF